MRPGLLLTTAALITAACGSTPVAPTHASAIPDIAGNYTVSITPSASCGTNSQMGFAWGGDGVPLIQHGADVVMTAQYQSFAALTLEGTIVKGGSVTFSVTAQAAIPIFVTTASGKGTARIQGDVVSGLLDGALTYKSPPTGGTPVTCQANDHMITLTRVHGLPAFRSN